GIRYDLVTGVQTCALPISFQHDNAASPEPMVSIRNFSGEAALSCWKVMPARRATSTKVTTVCEDGQTRGDAAKAIPTDPAYLSSSRLESFRTCVNEEILDSSVGRSHPRFFLFGPKVAVSRKKPNQRRIGLTTVPHKVYT